MTDYSGIPKTKIMKFNAMKKFFPYIFIFAYFASVEGQDLDLNSVGDRINDIETRIDKLQGITNPPTSVEKLPPPIPEQRSNPPATLVAKKSDANSGEGQSGMDKVAIAGNPTKKAHGIAIGNHMLLNGYFHARFHSVDHEKASGSWFQAFDDYLEQDNYFTALSELYLTLTLGSFDLNSRFYISESALGTQELYGQVNFGDTLRLKLGKLEYSIQKMRHFRKSFKVY